MDENIKFEDDYKWIDYKNFQPFSKIIGKNNKFWVRTYLKKEFSNNIMPITF